METKLTTILQDQDWYVSLIEDLESAFKEGIHSYRWILIKTYHLIGRRILEEKARVNNIAELCNSVAKSLGKSERTIYQAVQFAKKYPDLDKVPEGKNISWHKIVNKYLPDSKKECDHEPEAITRCRKCHKKL